jgi:hypothetical protein
MLKSANSKDRYLDYASVLKFQPYQQGNVDCLCGIYAMINAVKYLKGHTTFIAYRKLLVRILKHLETHGKTPLLERISHEGTSMAEIASVLKYVICPKYDIQRAKPYHHNPNTTLANFLRHCQGFLEQKKGIILIGIEGAHSHWTLIYEITDTRLLLKDSSNLKYLGKRYCCLPSDNTQKTHILYPVFTYFLWID